MSQVLLQAAESGLYDDVVELINEGADVNYQNPDLETEGYTALMEATLNLDVRMMTYLLQQGAEVNREDHNGMTAINHLYAEYIGNDEADLLPALELLHAFHADLDHTNFATQDTLIQWAAFNGHINIVMYLLDKGIDPNQAIEEAREGENPEMIALLEEAIQERTTSTAIGTELDDEAARMSYNNR
jgi:ankyrin repeat protein